jgi:hypothetical protein
MIRATNMNKNTDVPRQAVRQWLRHSLAIACLCLPLTQAWGQTASAPPVPFVISADAEPNSYVHRWVSLIYGEAFRCLGIPVQISSFPLARGTALANQGSVDGQAGRIRAYGDTHPDMVRVEEPVMDFTFSLYTANPALHLQRAEDLAGASLQVEYRRGILFCQNTMTKFVAADRLSDITHTEQGLKKLVAGRTDIYCDIEVYVRESLNTPEFKDSTGLRKLFDLASVQTYPYVNRKHAALAPKLAAVLKQMRAEGLLKAYPQQAEREMGWTR